MKITGIFAAAVLGLLHSRGPPRLFNPKLCV